MLVSQNEAQRSLPDAYGAKIFAHGPLLGVAVCFPRGGSEGFRCASWVLWRRKQQSFTSSTSLDDCELGGSRSPDPCGLFAHGGHSAAMVPPSAMM